MDVHKILAELYEDRDRIDAAIAALDSIAASTGQRRRGRPPKWLIEARAETAPTKHEGTGKAKPKKKKVGPQAVPNSLKP